LFDIPRSIAYFNAASMGPLPRATVEAARAAAARKARPWTIDPAFQAAQHERARTAAARLINAAPEDVALIPSISYAIATAARLLPVARGQRVLVLKDDHSSPVLEWTSRAEAGGFTVETIAAPADGDWTAAVLAAIERPGAVPLALASISSMHWSQGALIDVAHVAAALRRVGAAFVLDATQTAGVIPLDVATLDPDLVAFPTYKWLIGPYGRAFMYVARRHQGGLPLEQTPHGRNAVRAENDVYFADTRHVARAERFDMGERDHFIGLEMASLGIERVLAWGVPAIRDRLASLTSMLAEGLKDLPVTLIPEPHRTPHILGVGFPSGMPADLMDRLARDDVHAARRIGRLRLSPHVYNDEADVERCLASLRRHLA
jgi:selenocysteine lyase/cysteine desulfurase